jgi:hypothetical protein
MQELVGPQQGPQWSAGPVAQARRPHVKHQLLLWDFNLVAT